jgi:hypothetical protein
MNAAPILRLARPLVFAAALAACLAGCNSAPGAQGSCGDYCGNASGRVTFQGATTTISGGGCHDNGSAGFDARIGDWQNGVGNYLWVTGYRPGGATPAPVGTSAEDQAPPPVSGSVSGTPFILGPDAIVTFTGAAAGTFSGEDVNGYGPVSGSFTCG